MQRIICGWCRRFYLYRTDKLGPIPRLVRHADRLRIELRVAANKTRVWVRRRIKLRLSINRWQVEIVKVGTGKDGIACVVNNNDVRFLEMLQQQMEI